MTPMLRPRFFAALSVQAVFCLLVGLVASGCATQNVVSTRSDQTLRQEIRRTDRPVLVFFYKLGCPTSVAMEPGMDQLAKDYPDQLIVVRYMHVWPWLQVNSWDVATDHKVLFCPTVILFSNGQEQMRWVSDYYMPHYYKGIDQVLSKRAKPASSSRAANKSAGKNDIATRQPPGATGRP